MREISNQYLPNKQNFQTKWVDFPNHLHPKEEVAFESEQEEMKEEAIVEHYLPFLCIMALREPDDVITFFNDNLVAGSLSMTSLLVG